MRKFGVVICAVGVLAGCNLMKKTGDSADGAAAGSSSTSGATTSAPSIVDKALTFLSGGPFEGEVTMTNTSTFDAQHAHGMTPPAAGPQTMTIVYQVKGDKMRFNTPTGGAEAGYVIFDVPAKKMTTISDAKKTAMVMSLDPTGGGIAQAAASGKSTVDKTSQTDTVAGYSCDVYKIAETNGDKSEACLAKGIHFPQMGKGANWLGDLGGDVFPMRVVTTDPTGKEKNRMQVTKVERKTLDDSLFTVPAGYKVMNMDDMMKAFSGMGGGAHH
jgi:hypothetical protein